MYLNFSLISLGHELIVNLHIIRVFLISFGLKMSKLVQGQDIFVYIKYILNNKKTYLKIYNR